MLFAGELDGGPGRDEMVYFDEACLDRYLERHGYGVVAETSNETSDGSNETEGEPEVQDDTSGPQDPSSPTRRGTGRHRPGRGTSAS